MPTFTGPLSNASPEGDSVPTPYITSEQTSGYTDYLQKTSAQADEQPLRYLHEWNVVEKALTLVDRAREQGADWDDEEGQAVPFATAKRAKDLLIDTASRGEAAGKTWASPAVSATPEGGIHFSWVVAGNRVALTIFAPDEHTICVSKLHGKPSHRELLSDYGAVARVLKAFEASPFASPGGHRSNPR